MSDEARYLTGPGAARYLGVCPNTFRKNVRPLLPVHDFGTPGQPVLRYAIADLDQYAASRRKERKTA